MSTAYDVRALSYGWELSWCDGDGHEHVALVILENAGVYRCCRCQASSCKHAAHVREHVMRHQPPGE